MGWVALATALLAAIGGHVLREAARVAVVLACVQALASGLLLWSTLPRRLRWLGPAGAAVLLTGIGLGAWVSPQAGVTAASGLSHALLYGALLFVFARSLRPGRTAVVTQLARRINPHFRAEMVPYTRKVTLAWALFAGAQLAASAVLLGAGMLGPWLLLVSVLHAPLAAGLAIGEYVVRCWHFPGEHTSLAETIRGIRGGLRS